MPKTKIYGMTTEQVYNEFCKALGTPDLPEVRRKKWYSEVEVDNIITDILMCQVKYKGGYKIDEDLISEVVEKWGLK